jgi:protein tyrosine phosphatase (PTP) superfamily phosphohydrolase (DUF442 family)
MRNPLDRLPPNRRRLVRRLAIAAAIIFTAIFIHYWPGRGYLTYLGFDVTPAQFDLSAPSGMPLASPRDDVPGVANFAWISEDLCRGAQPTREGFVELQKMGVRTIVNLRETRTDRLRMKGLGLQYIHIRFNPAGPTDAEVATFMQVVRTPVNQPAFVHCLAGSDRTGTVVAIYRVMEQDWPMQEAVKELPSFGFHHVWNDLLVYLANFDPTRIDHLIETQPPPRVRIVQ